MDGIPVKIFYTDWLGVTRDRELIPYGLWYGSTQWYPGKQYLLRAMDCEDRQVKDFALTGFRGSMPMLSEEGLVSMEESPQAQDDCIHYWPPGEKSYTCGMRLLRYTNNKELATCGACLKVIGQGASRTEYKALLHWAAGRDNSGCATISLCEPDAVCPNGPWALEMKDVTCPQCSHLLATMVHWATKAPAGSDYSLTAACQPGFGYTRLTTDHSKITCPDCLKLFSDSSTLIHWAVVKVGGSQGLVPKAGCGHDNAFHLSSDQSLVTCLDCLNILHWQEGAVSVHLLVGQYPNYRTGCLQPTQGLRLTNDRQQVTCIYCLAFLQRQDSGEKCPKCGGTDTIWVRDFGRIPCPLCNTKEKPMAKKPLRSLTRRLPQTPEGKYLVKRRDGTVPPWPSFVLGGADPIAAVALRAYAGECLRLLARDPDKAAQLGLTQEFACDVYAFADEFDRWREVHGQGDPGMGPHRKDDPATIEEMKKGYSA
jgi:hypothetical protein